MRSKNKSISVRSIYRKLVKDGRKGTLSIERSDVHVELIVYKHLGHVHIYLQKIGSPRYSKVVDLFRKLNPNTNKLEICASSYQPESEEKFYSASSTFSNIFEPEEFEAVHKLVKNIGGLS